jgi:hypothetical protein
MLIIMSTRTATGPYASQLNSIHSLRYILTFYFHTPSLPKLNLCMYFASQECVLHVPLIAASLIWLLSSSLRKILKNLVISSPFNPDILLSTFFSLTSVIWSLHSGWQSQFHTHTNQQVKLWFCIFSFLCYNRRDMKCSNLMMSNILCI